ncbi:antibiotic biosynthesis monooxygenase [Levilactobacillus zymae]|uniref:antibiotic biosynthesis monooxygenase family protein n=1 Tax=Levilactobacillus zymae TaxID=267363 RepID=UPI0028BAA88F|nr:antibiotic biosynthesis monooxygenase [Levilactobacillus zymae]MDT6980906.1 monooxygenase [Levilactobacillus zymae]
MLQSIALTFGSEEVLTKLMAAHPDREFVLLANSTGDDDGLQLLDVSGQPSIFATHFDYRVNCHQGVNDWHGFFEFSYFEFNQDTADVFEAKANRLAANPLPTGLRALYLLTKVNDRGSYILLTQWDNSQSYTLWRHSPVFTPLDRYATSANHFHSAGYKRATIKAVQ